MNGHNATAAHRRGAAAAERNCHRRAALIAAYCDGLGLAPVAVICGPAGIRIAAIEGGESLGAAETVQARWWCRRPAQAERVAAAANARLRRRKSCEDAGCALTPVAPEPGKGPPALLLGRELIVSAARQAGVVLQSDAELRDEAMLVIERVEGEIERLQRAGDLQSVNKSYREYRIAASQRGERVAPYQQWMGRYREKLVRKLAATLRYL